jgi:hypothetical protein
MHWLLRLRESIIEFNMVSWLWIATVWLKRSWPTLSHHSRIFLGLKETTSTSVGIVCDPHQTFSSDDLTSMFATFSNSLHVTVVVDFYELRPPTNLLFIPKVMYEYEEPRWNDIVRVKPKSSENNLSQCHFVHHVTVSSRDVGIFPHHV